MRTLWAFLAAATLAVLPGCSEDENVELEVADTEGVRYLWSCEQGDQNCDLVSLGGDACGRAEWVGGLFMVACWAPEIRGIQSESCRPIVCDDDASCPVVQDRKYTCGREGWCAYEPLRQSQGPGISIVAAACLASFPRGTECLAVGEGVEERYRLVADAARRCDETGACPMPDACLE